MAASFAPPPRRPSRGALLTVSLSSSESAEWALASADGEEFRAAARARARQDARARNRKFFEIYSAGGERLDVGES
jgi:hypothetical protein